MKILEYENKNENTLLLTIAMSTKNPIGAITVAAISPAESPPLLSLPAPELLSSGETTVTEGSLTIGAVFASA